MNTGPWSAYFFARLVSWLNSRLLRVIIAAITFFYFVEALIQTNRTGNSLTLLGDEKGAGLDIYSFAEPALSLPS
jgi:hypothetical protein